MGDFSVGRAAFFGFGLVRRDPLSFLGVALMYTALAIAAVAMMAGPYATLLDTSLGPAAQDPQAMLSAMGQFYAAIAPFYLLSFVLSVVAMGAMHRSLLFDGDWGWFLGLKLGLDELRLFLLFLALIFVIGAPYTLGAVLLGVAAGVTGAVLGHEALVGLILFPGVIGLMVLLVWLMIRFSAAGSMTIAERRFSLFRSFKVTKGKAWSLFAAYLILYMLVFVVMAGIAIVATVIFAGAAVGFDAEDPYAFIETMRNVSVGPMVIVGSVLYGVISAFLYSAWTGVGVYAYRVLAQDAPEDVRLQA